MVSDAMVEAAYSTYCVKSGIFRTGERDRMGLMAMRAALEAAEAVRWRDVKTDPPPRDGTRIVVWIDESSEAMVAFWGKHYWLDEEWWIATDEMNAVDPEYVTRWLTLPPAPEAHDEGR